MILVTGANGQLGGATIRHLLAKGAAAANITAMVRSEDKAKELRQLGVNIRIGDYNEYSSLVQAFTGANKVLLVSGSDISNRSKQHLDAVRAAKEAGVQHVFYTSFERKNEGPSSPIAFVAKSHIDAEVALKESGMAYTIFRNNIYADMLPWFLGEQVLSNGVFFPAGNTPVAFTLRNDMAEAMANVLLTEGHANKVYGISHPQRITFSEIAQHLSDISGKQINYANPDASTYQTVLSQLGVPQDYIGMFAGFAEAMKQGEFDTHHTDLPSLLQREPSSVKEFLQAVYSKN